MSESWAQTLMTVTPEEDAAIRTITDVAVISGLGDDPLVLGVDQIAERRSSVPVNIRRELFIEPEELEDRRILTDAECQTFLQGVPKVEVLESALRDEATQTMYLGNIPHRTTLRDITEIMNDRVMPVAGRITESTQTIVTCDPERSREYVVDRLTARIKPQELLDDDHPEETDACVSDNLQFIIERVFWLSDPGYRPIDVRLTDGIAQTCIKYDHRLEKIVQDAETQTSLTCEPKKSNAGLLSEWSALKEFAEKMINECFETGVYPRIVIHSILDEIVERCAEKIHFPYKNEASQTLAPCNALEDKDDEMLRKLRVEVVLDPLESSVIVLPLVEILLRNSCLEITRKAPDVAGEILDRVQRNSVKIAIRLAEIRKGVLEHKPKMDDIFDARKKRLKELLDDKKSAQLCSSTQTNLAGVPDLGKIAEPKKLAICSACVKHSDCYVCEEILEDELIPDDVKEGYTIPGKIRRTQDILIAYNPCYLTTNPSKIQKIQHAPVKADFPVSSTPFDAKINPLRLDEVCQKNSPSVKLKIEGKSSSLENWGKVVQESPSISGAWSIRGSVSVESSMVPKEVEIPSLFLSRKSGRKECIRSEQSLSISSFQALRILKRTFNRREESCSDCEDRKGKKELAEDVRIIPIIHIGNKMDNEK